MSQYGLDIKLIILTMTTLYTNLPLMNTYTQHPPCSALKLCTQHMPLDLYTKMYIVHNIDVPTVNIPKKVYLLCMVMNVTIKGH